MATSNTDSDNSLLQPMYRTVLGGSGTRSTQGFIFGEEYLPQLMWRRGIEVYDHMRRDASIQGMLKAVKHPLLAATYDIQAASDEEFDQFVMRHVKNELFDRNVKWRDFLRDVLGKCDFGFSLFEKTYELTQFEDKPVVGIKELGWRKQWSILRWATSQDQPGVTQELLTGPVDIPEAKLLAFVNDKEGDNYSGISLLRYAFAPWDRKKSLDNFLMVAASRSLGFPIVEYFEDNDKKDHDRVENVLKNFRSHEQQYLFFPMGKYKWDWGKIETNIKTDLLPAIEHYQQEINRSVLAQFLDLAGSRSGGTAGSHALSEDHSQLFEKALEAIVNEIVDKINTDLIQQLCDLTWSELPNGYPKLVYSNIGDQNLTIIGDYVSKLAQFDILTPDPDLENKLREDGDLPPLPDDIYNNYDQRMTAQTQAVPLTQLGPAQNPNAPAPTGKPLKNPPIDQKGKPAEDQDNAAAPANDKSDAANKPTPYPNSKAPARAADELAAYRRDLISRVMADDAA